MDSCDLIGNNLIQEEFVAELFDGTPTYLFQLVRHIALQANEISLSSLETSILKRCVDETEKERVKEINKKLRSKWMLAVENLLKLKEEDIKKFFYIPRHIVLLQNSPPNFLQCVETANLTSLETRINSLKTRYRRAVCMEMLLLKEKSVQTKSIDLMYRKVLELEETVSNICKDGAVKKESFGLTLKMSHEIQNLFAILDILSKDQNDIDKIDLINEKNIVIYKE